MVQDSDLPEYIERQGLGHLWNKPAEAQESRVAFRDYERDMQALEGLRFRSEADEVIALVFSTMRSPTRTRRVAEYLSMLVGDEVAAADASAEAILAHSERHVADASLAAESPVIASPPDPLLAQALAAAEREEALQDTPDLSTAIARAHRMPLSDEQLGPEDD